MNLEFFQVSLLLFYNSLAAISTCYVEIFTCWANGIELEDGTWYDF